jgi:hypothetical protein
MSAAVACELIPDDHDGIVHALTIQGGPKASKPTIELDIRAVA